MQMVGGIARVSALGTLPTTILVVALYTVLFLAVFYTDKVPAVPKDQHGLNLTEAYVDLGRIAAHPHPFLSHANDQVHSFILGRLNSIAKLHPHVEVVNDVFTNASLPAWNGGGNVVYHEATNLLVKVQGTDPTKPGVLFSAHYDSVSTASGATDDGMGVATLIQLVQYFGENRPTRTAIININNGEEDGLNGAYIFTRHPWANLTDSFLNLEGAGSGGRPLLFRGTSLATIEAFHVPHPHANVISADAFAIGLVRSGTDYSVYTESGMQGLDFAFYKGRSKYHTKYDAIPYTVGHEAALWAMMESAKSAGSALLNSDETHGGGPPAVYFDLFGLWLVVMPLRCLYIVNIFLLVAGPLVMVVVAVAEASILRGRRAESEDILNDENFQSNVPSNGAWSWAKFWVGVGVSVALQALLVFLYLRFNPYIVHSRPSLVITSSFTLAYLSLVLVTTPVGKQVMYFQTYILTWILLALSTVAVNAGIGGVYFVTAWNAAIWLACLLGSIENMVGAQHQRTDYTALPHQDDKQPVEDGGEEAVLLFPEPQKREESGALQWWIPQLVLAVGVPVTLLIHITVLMVASLSQTLADGSPPNIVYIVISTLIFMTVLCIVPFTSRIHSFITTTCIILFIVATIYGLTTFPFSAQEPLKVSFQQTIALGDVSSPNAEIKFATSTVIGVEQHFVQDLLKMIPSATEPSAELRCVANSTAIPGLAACSWKSQLLSLPSPDDKSTAPARWVTANATISGPTSARFVVAARNSRGCRLTFTNGNLRVKSHFVHGAKEGKVSVAEEYTEMLLWSRQWGRQFTVDVEWEVKAGEASDRRLQGTISCLWAEYASGSAGVNETGRIPAFEEIVTLLPTWGVVTRQAQGLVKASYTYSV
ncbi:Peptide hydrolase [Mycena indigotica]|uniref:Peptide hydrolase n=1 Tax=Mycena indigotica TaxID=2126181 RepID=A0A8H6SAS8_9AGAR|nr:Peptide hydrolase [Mycena indigotica]KAF7295537.1 Peptide hydrolase [Mycena indigotica]